MCLHTFNKLHCCLATTVFQRRTHDYIVSATVASEFFSLCSVPSAYRLCAEEGLLWTCKQTTLLKRTSESRGGYYYYSRIKHLSLLKGGKRSVLHARHVHRVLVDIDLHISSRVFLVLLLVFVLLFIVLTFHIFIRLSLHTRASQLL